MNEWFSSTRNSYDNVQKFLFCINIHLNKYIFIFFYAFDGMQFPILSLLKQNSLFVITVVRFIREALVTFISHNRFNMLTLS